MPTAVDPAAAPMRILVVDDDELDRLAVRRHLQRSGIAATVDDAASGPEAIARVVPDAYDCILLDYYIPGVDTLALLRQFHATAKATPVIVFTGYGYEELAVEFMKAGAVDYLPKASLTSERLARSFRYALETALAVAARRRAEEQLREREAEFRTLANMVPQLAWMADPEGRRYWFNARWYEYTGLRPDQALGLGWRLAHHPDHRARTCNTQLRAFERGEAWEDTVCLRRADGRFRWFLSRALPVRNEQGRILRWIGTNTDVTELREAERALAASERRFRRALDIETVGVIFFNVDGAITGANDAFLGMSGYSREDLNAGRVRWDKLTPAEFMPKAVLAVEEFRATGRITPYEKQFIRKDGSRRWALFAGRRLSNDESVVYVLDISEDKGRQLERDTLLASEQSARAEAEYAVKARDQVLAVVSHDLRNPLQTISTVASTLAMTVDDEKQRRLVEIIQLATKGMDRLLNDLLDVARMDAGALVVSKAPVDLARLIREVLELFEPQALERRVVLRSEVQDDIPPVSADRDRLMQVLANLVGNALKFTAAGQGHVVRVRAAICDGGVQLSVKDSGAGIRADDLPRIFDRFWQADVAKRTGAGLGLAIAKAIAEAHGGRIWAASKLGRGTTFYLQLPFG